MKIGIVGLGVVGTACFEGFRDIGNDVVGHDIKFNSKLEDLIDVEIIYICVPTPSNHDGSCNTEIVEQVVKNLHELKFDGIIAIKSTVEPGFTQKLIEKYSNDKICFVPEFLRERCAKEDFLNYGSLIIGSANSNINEKIILSHRDIYTDIKTITPSEAELLKYFHNTFNAVRISFANSFFEISQNLDINYDVVLDCAISRNSYNKEYLRVNDDLRGFAGPCLPKDTKAIASFCEKNSINTDIFKAILKDNDNRKKTVLEGMREE